MFAVIAWPTGPTWFFLVIVAAIILGPLVAERLRLPGILGLLAAGFLIGPAGLGMISSTESLEGLGHIGVLYLMALAGLELDLNVFAAYRRSAGVFGALTFAFPFIFGIAGVLLLNLASASGAAADDGEFSVAAAVLLGSLLASHTLIAYPIVRGFGLANNPAVAVTVGATVITDTAALLVLAVVAGAVTGESSGVALAVSLAIGLVVLAAYSFVVLPRAADLFFEGMGQERVLRFLFVLGGFLSAALLADLLGLEGIVGAFFAGLGLNRFVPNGGALMERVEFFGSAFFIPVFMISVGLLIEPAVLLDRDTLVLGGVLTLAVVAGKAVAAMIARRLNRFSAAETGVVFSLSVAQAAATLAAATVGLQIGLFSDSVVNAIVLMITATLLITSATASRFAARVAVPARAEYRLGSSVVVPIDDVARAGPMLELADTIAFADAGLVVPIHIATEDDSDDALRESRKRASAIDAVVRREGIEAEPSFVVARSVVSGVRNAVRQHDGSLVLVERGRRLRAQEVLLGGVVDEILASSPVPVIAAAMSETPVSRVLLPIEPADLSAARLPDLVLSLELVRRIARRKTPVVVGLRSGTSLPDDEPLPEGVDPVAMPAGRSPWIAEEARPGDLILIPAGLGAWAVRLDADRYAASEGVSVAIVAGAYRAGGAVSTGDLGRQVVPSSA